MNEPLGRRNAAHDAGHPARPGLPTVEKLAIREDFSKRHRPRAESSTSSSETALDWRGVVLPSGACSSSRLVGWAVCEAFGRSIPMPHFLRPFVLLLALLLVALPAPRPAQPPRLPRPPQPAQSEVDSTDLGGITLVPQKSPFVSHIDAARRAIVEEDWAVATTLLQKVLDLPEDALVQLTRKGPDGKETKVLVSLRAAADRLLEGFPLGGRAFYQREYGPKAAELLKQARLFGEPTILAEVMRRYLHTEAGAEAAERLATHHLDRGHSVLAALCFEKLIQRSGPSDLSGL